eukprot:GHVQ01012080.1.p1 GENE.GHVQ01012080.1~~GHVQ01012080.1.p1  ORF type:complete len:115 (+),score=16.73 GHVQ01012080.1:182-526(+)
MNKREPIVAPQQQKRTEQVCEQGSLYVYVCVCVCMFVYVCVCVYESVYICVCMCVYMYVCLLYECMQVECCNDSTLWLCNHYYSWPMRLTDETTHTNSNTQLHGKAVCVQWIMI